MWSAIWREIWSDVWSEDGHEIWSGNVIEIWRSPNRKRRTQNAYGVARDEHESDVRDDVRLHAMKKEEGAKHDVFLVPPSLSRTLRP